jgi:hypothetical protein
LKELGGGDPATSPLYVFGPFLRLIVVAGVAPITFGHVPPGDDVGGGWQRTQRGRVRQLGVEYTLTFLVSMAALVTFIADSLVNRGPKRPRAPLAPPPWRCFFCCGSW